MNERRRSWGGRRVRSHPPVLKNHICRTCRKFSDQTSFLWGRVYYMISCQAIKTGSSPSSNKPVVRKYDIFCRTTGLSNNSITHVRQPSYTTKLVVGQLNNPLVRQPSCLTPTEQTAHLSDKVMCRTIG